MYFSSNQSNPSSGLSATALFQMISSLLVSAYCTPQQPSDPVHGQEKRQDSEKKRSRFLVTLWATKELSRHPWSQISSSLDPPPQLRVLLDLQVQRAEKTAPMLNFNRYSYTG